MMNDRQHSNFGGFFDELESRPQSTDRLPDIFSEFGAHRSVSEGTTKPGISNIIPSYKASKSKV